MTIQLKKYYSIILLLHVFFFSFAYGDDLEIAENADIQEIIHEPLFVSLGSTCEVTHVLRGCGIRKAAFPFDWITTIDAENFLEILSRDFDLFLDESYLWVGNRGPGPLIHTYYHLEFLHEGDFRGDLYLPNMEKFQAKYQRRIERFKKLASHKGKVFFIRSAYLHSMTDPHRYYYCADNLEITDEYAWRLYHILQNRFPNLDFTLIIVNNDNGQGVWEEKRLDDRLIKIRSNSTLETSIKWKSYEKFFNSLYHCQSLTDCY